MRAQDLIDNIYRSRTVEDGAGRTLPLQSNVDAAEGQFLAQFIRERPNIIRTLEVGCAQGLSTLHIVEALKGRTGAYHIALDPFQDKEWVGVGVANLGRAGVDFFELQKERSEIALPRLLAEGRSFDLIFIDGWHTFDHTLVDLFYANRLLPVGGYIVLDDCDLRSVAKAASYFANYPCYRIAGTTPLAEKRRALSYVVRSIPPKLAGTIMPRRFYDRYYVSKIFPTMVAFEKIAPDERDWRWFESF